MTISDDKFQELGEAPQRTRTDEGTISERPMKDLIDTDRYIASRGATRVPWGMRVARTKPGGTV